jgi:hypothetical protein
MNDGQKLQGKLLEYADDKVVLEVLTDKKKKLTKVQEVPFSAIRQGKPVIAFK